MAVLSSRGDVPDAPRAVLSARGDARPVRGPGAAVDGLAVACERVEVGAGVRVPDPRGSIPAGREDLRAVRGEGAAFETAVRPRVAVRRRAVTLERERFARVAAPDLGETTPLRSLLARGGLGVVSDRVAREETGDND